MTQPSHPLSDHYDGRRFHNPPHTGAPKQDGAVGVLDLLRWRFMKTHAPWPDQVIDPSYPPPPAQIAPDDCALTFIGHASFLLNFAGLNILTDPVYSERCSPVSWAGPKRVRQPGLAFEALPRIDLVLISHNHYDHMDVPTLQRLQARDNPRIVTLLGNRPRLAQIGFDSIVELDWWQATALPAGSGPGINVTVTATPARHFSSRSVHDRNRTLWGGLMLEAGGRRVLFAGDSGTGPHWDEIGRRLGPPDLAMLPIGAYAPRWIMAPIHMNPAEAVAAHRALGARQSVGMHFGTFKLTDEAIDAPVLALEQACREQAVSRFDLLGCGETRVFPLGAAAAETAPAATRA